MVHSLANRETRCYYAGRADFYVDLERVSPRPRQVQNEALRTLPVGLAFFQGKYTANIPLMAAGAIIVALPTILIYVLFQRFFIRGMLGGAVKG